LFDSLLLGSRWEKRGRGGSENESVKPLNGVQPVISGPVKAVAGGPVASIASRRATGGGEAYTARKQAVRIQLRHRFVIATPTPLAWRKAASGQPLTRGCFGVAGVPSPGHAFKGTPREPRRARAATLAVDPAGESPAGGNCPVATVVISGNGEGDQTVESPDVKVSCKGGEQLSRS
jgi:hypothetical protein